MPSIETPPIEDIVKDTLEYLQYTADNMPEPDYSRLRGAASKFNKILYGEE